LASEANTLSTELQPLCRAPRIVGGFGRAGRYNHPLIYIKTPELLRTP
jgi:hypothetical protein